MLQILHLSLWGLLGWHKKKQAWDGRPTFIGDSRKLTDDNKKRKRKKPCVIVVMCPFHHPNKYGHVLRIMNALGVCEYITNHIECALYILFFSVIIIFLTLLECIILWLFIIGDELIPKLYHIKQCKTYLFVFIAMGNEEWWTSSCVFYCSVSRTHRENTYNDRRRRRK